MPSSSKGWIGTLISFSYCSMLFYLKVIHQSFVQIWKLTCCHELIKQFKSLFIKLKLLHKIIYHPGTRSNQKGQKQKFLLWISLLNELWFFFLFRPKKTKENHFRCKILLRKRKSLYFWLSGISGFDISELTFWQITNCVFLDGYPFCQKVTSNRSNHSETVGEIQDYKYGWNRPKVLNIITEAF